MKDNIEDQTKSISYLSEQLEAKSTKNNLRFVQIQ